MQSESEVVKECVEYMHRCGWRPKRNHVGTFYTRTGAPVHMGDKGEPDWTFTHPTQPAIWVEMKATGKQPRPEQLEFIAKLKHLGYRATWVDSVAGVKEWLRHG